MLKQYNTNYYYSNYNIITIPLKNTFANNITNPVIEKNATKPIVEVRKIIILKCEDSLSFDNNSS